MEILFLGVVCVGLGLYVLYLQNKLESAQEMMTHMIDAMYDAANGDVKFVRTENGVRAVPLDKKQDAEDDKLLS